MKTVNIHGAKSSLSSRLAKLESDCKTIVVCRHGEPVGDLEPHRRARRIKTPPVLGKIKLGYDPVEPPAREEWPPEARLTHPAADKPQYYMPSLSVHFMQVVVATAFFSLQPLPHGPHGRGMRTGKRCERCAPWAAAGAARSELFPKKRG